ncbi:MAG: hypothetical protein II725_07090 [Firmicutes bacterium]|nr:hypothetical protein [Bacillota bacterium]
MEEDEVEGFTSEISTSGHRFTITNTKNAGEPPRAVLDPPLQKTIEIKGEGAYDGSSSFTFVMEAKEADAPMPDGMRGGRKTRTVHDAGSYEFGEMEFGPEDVDREYTYYIREVHGSDERFTYDDRSYTMHVAVRVLDGKIVLSVSYIRSDNVRTSVMEFVNTFEAPEKPEDPGESGEEPHDPGTPGAPGDPEDESTEEEEEVDDPNNPQAGIPQTGQLWWPVPVLAVSGLLLCIAGMMLRRKSGNA